MPSPEDVLRETAEARVLSTAELKPITITGAVEDARHLRKQPEFLLDGPSARKIIEALLSALEQSPCYLKAVMTGHRTFVLVDWDRAAPQAMQVWADRASDRGCRQEKVDEVRRTAHAWAAQDQLQTKWPD